MGCFASKAALHPEILFGVLVRDRDSHDRPKTFTVEEEQQTSRQLFVKLQVSVHFTVFEMQVLEEHFKHCKGLMTSSPDVMFLFLTNAEQSVTNCEVNTNVAAAICEFLQPRELLNFSVCIQILSIFSRGSCEEQLTYLFCLLDHDSSSFLLHSDLHVLVDIFIWSHDPANMERYEQRKDKILQQLLAVLGANDEGQVSFSTFLLNTAFISEKLGLEDRASYRPTDEQVMGQQRERRPTEMLGERVRVGLALARQHRVERDGERLGGASSSTGLVLAAPLTPTPHLSPHTLPKPDSAVSQAGLSSHPSSGTDPHEGVESPPAPPLTPQAQPLPSYLSATPGTPSPAVPVLDTVVEPPPMPPLIGASMKDGNLSKEWRGDMLMRASMEDPLGSSMHSRQGMSRASSLMRPGISRASSVMRMQRCASVLPNHHVINMSMRSELGTVDDMRDLSRDGSNETFAIDTLRANSTLGPTKRRKSSGLTSPASFCIPSPRNAARRRISTKRRSRNTASSIRDLADRHSAVSEDGEECKSVISVQPFVIDKPPAVPVQVSKATTRDSSEGTASPSPSHLAYMPFSPTSSFAIDSITALSRSHSVRSMTSFHGMHREPSVRKKIERTRSRRRPSGAGSPRVQKRRSKDREKLSHACPMVDIPETESHISTSSVHDSYAKLLTGSPPPLSDVPSTSRLPPPVSLELSRLSGDSLGEARPSPNPLTLVKKSSSGGESRSGDPPGLKVVYQCDLGMLSPPVAASQMATPNPVPLEPQEPAVGPPPVNPAVPEVKVKTAPPPPVVVEEGMDISDRFHPFDDTTPAASPTTSNSSPASRKKKRFSTAASSSGAPGDGEKRERTKEKKRRKKRAVSHVSSSSAGLLQTGTSQSSVSPLPSLQDDDDCASGCMSGSLSSFPASPRAAKRKSLALSGADIQRLSQPAISPQLEGLGGSPTVESPVGEGQPVEAEDEECAPPALEPSGQRVSVAALVPPCPPCPLPAEEQPVLDGVKGDAKGAQNSSSTSSPPFVVDDEPPGGGTPMAEERRPSDGLAPRQTVEIDVLLSNSGVVSSWHPSVSSPSVAGPGPAQFDMPALVQAIPQTPPPLPPKPKASLLSLKSAASQQQRPLSPDHEGRAPRLNLLAGEMPDVPQRLDSPSRYSNGKGTSVYRPGSKLVHTQGDGAVCEVLYESDEEAGAVSIDVDGAQSRISDVGPPKLSSPTASDQTLKSSRRGSIIPPPRMTWAPSCASTSSHTSSAKLL